MGISANCHVTGVKSDFQFATALSAQQPPAQEHKRRAALAAEADIHVLYVIVFKTPLYDESVGVENYRDYIQFMNKVGADSLRLPSKEAIGHRLNLNGKGLVCLHEYFQL